MTGVTNISSAWLLKVDSVRRNADQCGSQALVQGDEYLSAHHGGGRINSTCSKHMAANANML
jgi:hypothetical protein